ncbi:MAG: FecR domain-containing protein [Bacteroidetes bacterium]|nr:FecR domain-containing protein [Fibrella sp.]
MSQYDFDELLQKYLAGACDPAEEQLILAWYRDMSTKRPEPVDAQSKAAIRQRIWQKLAASTTRQRSSRRPTTPYWAVAAGLVLLVMTGIGWYAATGTGTGRDRVTAALAMAGHLELKNSSPSPQRIRLEDGSLVALKPGSTLSYPDHFGRHHRTVWLTGDAFFTVRKDPARPFMVHTGALVTEVLGTSFAIQSSDGARAIEVAVTTGRVSVYQAADQAHRRTKEVILKPNERITYSTHSQQLIPMLVARPVRVTAPTQPVNLLFDATPLPTVVARLQQLYGIDLFLESDGLNACVLNADLTELSLYDQLELVCRSVDARYEVRGTSIFIKGDGCQ